MRNICVTNNERCSSSNIETGAAGVSRWPQAELLALGRSRKENISLGLSVL